MTEPTLEIDAPTVAQPSLRVNHVIEPISLLIKSILKPRLSKRPPSIFAAPETRQFIAQGTAHPYSTNR